MSLPETHTPDCGANESRQALVVLGTVLIALASTACCWGPPVALAILGTSAGWLRALDPYQPYFLAFTVAQMLFGFYLAYRPAKPCCQEHQSVDPGARRRLNIGIMWAVAAFVVAINAWNIVQHREHPHVGGYARTEAGAGAASSNMRSSAIRA